MWNVSRTYLDIAVQNIDDASNDKRNSSMKNFDYSKRNCLILKYISYNESLRDSTSFWEDSKSTGKFFIYHTLNLCNKRYKPIIQIK